jgi:predicted transposase YbfD/YdcC
MSDLITHFSTVTDLRSEQGKRHNLIDIIAIAIVGIICGADDWVSIEMVGQAKEKWFRTFLELPHGIPSHDTFGKVFAWIDPKEFQASFMDWIQEIAVMTAGEVVALDGKTIRRSHDHANGKEALHMVNAWASRNELVIGQLSVADKSNEITAIPKLLELLDLKGCIVTMDAMGTQKDISRLIRAQNADYVLAVKGNQGGLHERVQSLFEVDRKEEFRGSSFAKERSVGKNHGRLEIRECWVTSDPEYLAYVDPDHEWDGLQSVGVIESVRNMGGHETKSLRYYISSLKPTAKEMLACVRNHWGVENSLHWSLDVVFREDDSRVRTGNAQENLAVMRKIALNHLRQEKTKKCGAKWKRLLCNMDHDYLLKVIHN